MAADMSYHNRSPVSYSKSLLILLVSPLTGQRSSRKGKFIANSYIQIRHSTIKMTERYAHLAMGNLKSAVDMLEHRSHSGHSTQPQQIRSVVTH